jgi:NADH:ubiquinone oxidoreductase subunit H
MITILLLIMLLIGVLSSIERLILAIVQHRIGPSSPAAFGLSISIADGIKLYSKCSTDAGSPHASVVLFTTCFLVSCLILKSVSLNHGETVTQQEVLVA